MTSWKVTLEEQPERVVEYVQFAQARKYFAIDASGSTGGAPLRAERNFAERLYEAAKGPNHNDNTITKWGTHCDNPTRNWAQIKWSSDGGGTCPSQILLNPKSLDAIRSCDIWVLITDGQVWDAEVTNLARLGQHHGIFSCPTIFLITSVLMGSPSNVDVSVVRFAHGYYGNPN
jgi:hypothetical protein